MLDQHGHKSDILFDVFVMIVMFFMFSVGKLKRECL